jgi:hypothetical protein
MIPTPSLPSLSVTVGGIIVGMGRGLPEEEVHGVVETGSGVDASAGETLPTRRAASEHRIGYWSEQSDVVPNSHIFVLCEEVQNIP